MCLSIASLIPALSSIGPNTVAAWPSPGPLFFFSARADEKSEASSSFEACPASTIAMIVVTFWASGTS